MRAEERRTRVVLDLVAADARRREESEKEAEASEGMRIEDKVARTMLEAEAAQLEELDSMRNEDNAARAWVQLER